MREDQVRTALELGSFEYSDKPGKNNSSTHFAINCPYCDDTSRHGGFKKTTGWYRCFKCGESLSLYRMLVDQVGAQSAQNIFVQIGVFEHRKLDPSKKEQNEDKFIEELLRVEPERTFKTGDVASKFANKVVLPENVVSVLQSPVALTYLTDNRGIPFSKLSKLEELGVLWFPKDLVSDEIDEKFLYAMGQRIAFPFYVDGEMFSWSARDVTGKSRLRYLTPSPKYCKQATTKLVYPFDFLLEVTGDVLLVQEGIFDSLPFNLTGSETGVFSCSLGTNGIANEQIGYIQRLSGNFNHVMILLDRDTEVQSLNVFNALRETVTNLSTYYIPRQIKDTGQLPFSSIPKVTDFIKRLNKE